MNDKRGSGTAFAPDMYTALNDFAVFDLQTAPSRAVTAFLAASAPAKRFCYAQNAEILPKGLKPGQKVLLIAPMDAESPKTRLLRPQAMALEACLRNGNIVEIVNLDCAAARAGSTAVLKRLKKCILGADLIISDS